MRYEDYYATLGVSRGASADEIKKAYRRLSKEYHPDRNPSKGAEEQFKKVSEAYEVLKDPARRSRYDALGSGHRAGDEFRPPSGFSGWQNVDFDFGGGAGGAGGPMGGFSDFFETFFRGPPPGQPDPYERFRSPKGTRSGRAEPPKDTEAELQVTLEECMQGTTKVLELSRTVRGADGGRRTERHPLTVRIPPGASEGTRIRLKGKADPGPLGGAPGDVVLTLRLAPHPRFEVSGHDLLTRLPITPWEAALGARVPLLTLGGEVTLTVPPGSSSGRRMRLRGRGLPRKSGEPGNLDVELIVAVPKTLSDEEQRLFTELRQASQFDPRAAS